VIKVLFICHGNICRSPMAEFIMKSMVEAGGAQDRFEIASAATSTEEIWGGRGNPVYPPAQAELRRHGIGKTAYTNFTGKRARQITPEDYDHYDLILCAEPANVRNTLRIIGPDRDHKVKLLLDFAEDPARRGRAISDPWYSDDFATAYSDIDEGVRGLLKYLKEQESCGGRHV